MFITFEGIDGCGKSTQLKLLNEYFLKQNKQTLIIREPGGTKVSEKIREILLSKNLEMTNITELLLFAAARNSLVEKVIKPALKQGIYVLSDRFFDSTTAYQGYGREINLDYIKIINEIATNGLKPNLTFFLDVPIEIANKRSKNKNKDRIEASGNEFYEKVIKGYYSIANDEPNRIKIINSKGSISYTHNLILNIIKNISQ
jgi:dTMP kinase